MTEQATTANKRSNIVLRRTLPTLLAAFAVWALVSSFLALDITEYGLVTRFGRVVRVLAEPGLHVVAPFDRVVRLDKRILFFRPALSEYLTIDKKNLGVDSLVTWRIADPVRFLAAVATPPAGEQRLSDIILAEIGAVVGRYPASVLISTDPASSNYQTMAAEVVRRVAEFARTAYGIDVVSVDIRRLHLQANPPARERTPRRLIRQPPIHPNFNHIPPANTLHLRPLPRPAVPIILPPIPHRIRRRRLLINRITKLILPLQPHRRRPRLIVKFPITPLLRFNSNRQFNRPPLIIHPIRTFPIPHQPETSGIPLHHIRLDRRFPRRAHGPSIAMQQKPTIPRRLHPIPMRRPRKFVLHRQPIILIRLIGIDPAEIRALPIPSIDPNRPILHHKYPRILPLGGRRIRIPPAQILPIKQ